MKTLAEMKPGEFGVVTKVNGTGNIKYRLIDMGVVKGSRLQVIKYAPMGDPIEIKVKGFTLALRKNEAAMIEVEMGGEA